MPTYDINSLIKSLKSEKIKTWFDIGLFLDKLKKESIAELHEHPSSFDDFKNDVSKGVAIINYSFTVDGVTIESIKYAKALEKLFKGVQVHWIAGFIDPNFSFFKSRKVKKYVLKGMDGFENWGDPYFKLFHTKLERGGEDYNSLPKEIWSQALKISESLLKYFNKNNIRSMIITNVASNPGNLALTLAAIILSEKMGIPVISSNHDFYWEEGKAKRKPGEKKGARDHFFTNHDIGEIFSLIQVMYPWSSRHWVHMNINKSQTDKLISKKGINPSNSAEITTAVDLEIYRDLKEPEINKIKARLNNLFRSYNNYMPLEECGKDFKIVKEKSHSPFVVGAGEDKGKNFFEDSILLLQPTRIIKRKRIEKNFDLLEGLFKSRKFRKYIDNGKKNVIMLVTGPVAAGSRNYFNELVERIALFYRRIPNKYASHAKFAFTLGDLKDKSTRISSRVLRISEVYEASNFVLFPSYTEGRGLPIIESSAGYVPIISARYKPKRVFREVVGENLKSKDRINVIEFPENGITSEYISDLVNLMTNVQAYRNLVCHNRSVVERRFSYESLEQDFLSAYERIWHFINGQTTHKTIARIALKEVIAAKKAPIKSIVYARKRKYIPGFNQLKYLSYLKTIIDPSYFRIEEQELRGRIYNFARKVRGFAGYEKENLNLFYKAVEELFEQAEGDDDIITDFSFEFRHRNRIHLLYQDLTEQELMGAVVMLFQKIFGAYFDSFSSVRGETNDIAMAMMDKSKDMTWKEKIKLAAACKPVATEAGFRRMRKAKFEEGVTASVHQEKLFVREVIEKPRHLIFLPGGLFELAFELKFFAQDLLEHWEKKKKKDFSITFGVKSKRFAYLSTKRDVMSLLKRDEFAKLRKYMKRGLFKVVKTGSISAGTNLKQANRQFLKELKKAKKNGGILVCKGDHNYATLDCVDIDSFRIGRVRHILASKINGFSLGKTYLQFIPAGFRPTYSYPVPKYRAYKFTKLLNSDKFKRLEKKHGRKELFTMLKKDMDEKGYSLIDAIERLTSPKKFEGVSTFTPINGKYADGNPYNGVLAKVDIKGIKSKGFKLEFVDAKDGYESVTSMVRRFHKKAIIAWNGGYILNPELVGKLALPESYIGTPLGMIIRDGKVASLPLFNRPVFAICKDGKIMIQRMSLNYPGSISLNREEPIVWKKKSINKESRKDTAVFSLLYKKRIINGKNKAAIKLAGNKIIEVVIDERRCELSPAGLTIVMDKRTYETRFRKYKEGKTVNFSLNLPGEWKDVKDAVEAGPLLIKEGKIDIELENEGWTHPNSIRTQASRLDYTYMRCPKIGVGVTRDGNLVVVAINARIRESTGATYHDIAEILRQNGAVEAMGFDPGGSTTVVVNGKQVNIPPYNPNFEDDPYQGKPVARKVANAVLGYLG